MKLIKTSQKSIYYVQNQNSVTYYFNYKNPITRKSTRKKLYTEKTHLEKHLRKCILQSEEIKKSFLNFNTNIIEEETEFKNYMSLNSLSKMYFDSKKNEKTRKLREHYNHLTEEEFENFQVVKNKLKNQGKEKKKYDKNVSQNLGILPLNKISTFQVNKFIEVNLGFTSLSQKSKFNIITLITTIINWGINQKKINISNPFKFVKFKNPQRQRERVLTEEEIKLLLNECKKYTINKYVYLTVYLGVLTSSRSNTVLNIQKKDIDIKNKTISLYNFKSDRRYKLQLNKKSIEYLKNVLKEYENDEYIIRPKNINRRKYPYQPMSGIPTKIYEIMDRLFNQDLNKKNNSDRDKVVNFHTIRRSISTNLVKNGTSVYNVMILLNHTSTTQTMKYLNISHNTLDNDISDLMNNIFND